MRSKQVISRFLAGLFILAASFAAGTSREALAWDAGSFELTCYFNQSELRVERGCDGKVFASWKGEPVSGCELREHARTQVQWDTERFHSVLTLSPSCQMSMPPGWRIAIGKELNDEFNIDVTLRTPDVRFKSYCVGRPTQCGAVSGGNN
jgi:hypothetical protein